MVQDIGDCVMRAGCVVWCVGALALAEVCQGLMPPARLSAVGHRRPAARLPTARPQRPQNRGASRQTTMFFQSGGGILGVGTPELVTICLVGWFVLGPKELYKLAKEIGKLVAQARAAIADQAAEWQSTIDTEFEFEGLNDVKAAAAELQDAFDFRSSRYVNQWRDYKPTPEVEPETAAAVTGLAAKATGLDAMPRTLDGIPQADLDRGYAAYQEQTSRFQGQASVDDWNAGILAREAATTAAGPRDEALTGLAAAAGAQARAGGESAELSAKKRDALDRIQRAYERKKRELELEYTFEQDKLAVELALSEDDIPASPLTIPASPLTIPASPPTIPASPLV
ncbi:hypothetical protein M885DRAFT_526029 [Pelagophyceae sp. CCMP2097]|nr:hypothetical protein M885DRAFT_526029 [Pelagophyceae sp. CCMP2097]|mmetsp:Transcript_1064/g.3910  ORF Transcript_1064/g.3910 Transcript_1064/m.3910 type:complete len:341 (-) Transcript_1064:102-1124(-)